MITRLRVRLRDDDHERGSALVEFVFSNSPSACRWAARATVSTVERALVLLTFGPSSH